MARSTPGALLSPRAGWLGAFAPASVANFGSGFDAFAAALVPVERLPGGRERLRPLGDVVRVRRSRKKGVRIVAISGDAGRLPVDADRNCASVAAARLLRRARAPFGLDLVLEKGLPLSSGLGSSAASAAAGAFAASLALGGVPDKSELLESSLEGEFAADGAWHGDNVWASLLGGGVVVASSRPPELQLVDAPKSLRFVVVHPDFELSTRRSRGVLPRSIPLADAAAQVARFGSFLVAWSRDDREALGRGLEDRFAEPRRARLIPGFAEAKRGAVRGGATGLTLSGAGPSLLAFARDGVEEKVGRAIGRAFRKAGYDSTITIAAVDRAGARPAGGKESR
jgi:homoserine kinase